MYYKVTQRVSQHTAFGFSSIAASKEITNVIIFNLQSLRRHYSAVSLHLDSLT
jgi:hypothetical protein